MKRSFISLLLALSVIAGAQAQDIRSWRDFGRRIDWSVGFDTGFDNRESNSEYLDSETIIGYKFTPIAGFSIGGGHRLVAGVDIIQDFGVSIKNQRRPEWMMWYDYHGEKLTVFAGSFSRTNMYIYPREFYDWSSLFFDPVMDGLLVRYNGGRWNVELAGDWFSKKSETEREQFMLYSHGTWRPSLALRRLSVGYYATMQHFSESFSEEGVVDNLLLKPWVGYNGRIRGTMVTWGASAAWLQAMQRDRLHENEWDAPGGFWADLGFRWRSLGILNAVYLGDDLMPYWGRYGSELYKGDQFFRTTNGVYNRLEAYWQPRIGKAVSLKVSTIHHYDGDSWSWQQLITFKVNLNRGTIR